MDHRGCLLTDRSVQILQIRQPNEWLAYGTGRPYSLAVISPHADVPDGGEMRRSE